MSGKEIFGFITPQFELLQLSFLIIILAMFAGTIISIHLNAKDVSWIKNWNNGNSGDSSDELDIDHGSVTDLWHAVATRSEKMAEIMPGMLLVVGLLGTFLGLGLALNHASNILGEPSALSTSGAANNMQDLMSMMQGLGTKFKTSTWGITFFLLLKVWSSWNGYEEKRLAWVIRKVKNELERRKVQDQEKFIDKQQTLFTQINRAAGQIVSGFSTNLDKFSDEQKNIQTKNLLLFKQWILDAQGNILNLNNTLLNENLAARQALEKHTQSICSELEIVKVSAQENSGKINNILENNSQRTHEYLDELRENIKNDVVIAKQVLEKNAQHIHADLTKIITCIQDNSEKTNKILEENIKLSVDGLKNITANMQSDSATIKQVLEQSTQGIRDDLASISTATKNSSEAMVGFVNSTKAIIKDMSSSSNKMADGAYKVGLAGSSLVSAVNDFNSQFTQVLGDVRTDLSTAINNMSEQAAQTLEQGTKELGKATLEISSALGVLSQDVTTTMNGVKGSIEKSLKIQQEGAILFRRSSDTLNENVTASTTLVEKLGEDIRSGLQAVSDSGRRMASIGKSLETIVPQMSDLLPALAPLKELNYQPLLQETQLIRVDLLQLKNKQELKNDTVIKIQQDSNSRFEKYTNEVKSVNKASVEIIEKLGLEIKNQLQEASKESIKLSSIGESIKIIMLDRHEDNKKSSRLEKLSPIFNDK